MPDMQTHSYRCHLIPEGMPDDLVELYADRGILPTWQTQAPNSQWAEAAARNVTGRRVARAERIEPVFPARNELAEAA